MDDALWALLTAMVVLVVILALQYTKHRLILPAMKGALWVSVMCALVGTVVLLSGWGKSGEANIEDLGTLSNSYYEPRREQTTAGGALFGGVLGALWWGATSWVVFYNGMNRGTTTNALVDFEVAVVVGALAGAIVGATLGLAAGFLWERRHRHQRRPSSS